MRNWRRKREGWARRRVANVESVRGLGAGGVLGMVSGMGIAWVVGEGGDRGDLRRRLKT